MSSSFPTELDDFPASSALRQHTLGQDPHSVLHGNIGEALEAVEAVLVGPTVYNVKGYGATGDGVTDDRLAIQAALDAAEDAGGGTVYLPPGTYSVTVAALSEDSNFHAGLLITSNVSLVGAGRGATTLKLANSQTGSSVSGNSGPICNKHINSATDARIRIADLTIDGNNTNQGSAVHNGITWRRVTDTICERVTVKNCSGLATSGYQETGHFFSANCSNLVFNDCWAQRTAGNTASGFHHNGCTGLYLTNCRASGMSTTNGFTHYACYHAVYTGCHAYQNAYAGFNCEESYDVTYQGCVCGGLSYSDSTPFSGSENLRNTLIGFVATSNSSRINYIGCQSNKNPIGIQADDTTDLLITGCSLDANNYATLFSNACSGRISNCTVSNSVTAGLSWIDVASEQAFRVSNCIYHGNAYDMATSLGGFSAFGNPAAVSVPASTTALKNPWPFDAMVYITGGTVTVVSVSGVATGLTTPCAVRVPATQTITLTYSVVPTWKWFID